MVLYAPKVKVGHQSLSKKSVTHTLGYRFPCKIGCHRESLEMGSQEGCPPSVSLSEAWGGGIHTPILLGTHLRKWRTGPDAISNIPNSERFLNSCHRNMDSPPDFIFLCSIWFYTSFHPFRVKRMILVMILEPCQLAEQTT